LAKGDSTVAIGGDACTAEAATADVADGVEQLSWCIIWVAGVEVAAV
jgi:hypothetical protein